MKAIVCHNYGPPDVLKLEEVGRPTAGDDEVLIKVRAASVNPIDRLIRGRPYIIRAMTGLRKPKDIRVGRDLAGQVEAVGRNVTQFQPGDEVFGVSSGAFAEYVCVDEKKLALKPVNLTFEQAAAVPIAGLTALQGLRDKGRIQPGQKVLINGASGGVGTFAVQIAKSFGVDVTAVCSTRNVDMVRSIGADHCIDYTQEDFAQSGQRYDLILDTVGNRSLSDCRRAMIPRGIYVVVGARTLRRLLKTPLLSPFVSQNLVACMSRLSKEDLLVLKELIEARKVTPVIDRSYTLSEVPEAIRYLEEGHARGKVVITLEDNN
ncbi:MAG: alcohol dehydrogenase [Acidobacteria bacterium]|nr:MAG: alcohol dehydrogenase [Acidobacteriota bacterium]